MVLAGSASAQEFLNPNVEGGCGMGTNKTVVASQVGGRSIRLPADGTVGTITFADDAIDDGTLDAEITGSCRQEGNKVTVVAKGRVVNRAAFTSNTQASAGFSLNMRPHAKPFNTDYLLRAAGNFTVTWDRGTPGALGGASAGFSMTNCDPGGNKSFGAGVGPAVQGVAVSSGTVECRRRSGNPFGFLESDVPISFGASVHQFAGAPQEFSFEGTVVFELLRVGKEIRVVAGPTEGSAGTPFPGPFIVLVINNGNSAAASGEPVRFRLLDSGGAEVQAVDATTLGDGKASANFTPPAGGVYEVEALCAGCPASSQELGQGSKVVFPAVPVLSGELTVLPGSREGPVGGTVELAFKATEKVLVGGVAQESPIVGTPVGFMVTGPAGDAALSPNPATTGPDGVVRTTLTLGSAGGTYEVTANCAACRVKPSENIVVEAIQSAVALVKDTTDNPTAGDGQRAFVGDFLPFRLRVKLQSGGVDRLLAGVTIQFLIEPLVGAKGSWVSPDVSPTDSSGRASTVLTLGAQPGDYVVRAVCDACTANREVTFTATAQPIPTFVAGFLGDFWDGPSVSLPLNRTLNALLPEVSADITATGNPPGLSYSWEIVKGSDKVRLEGPTDGPMVSLLPLAASVNVNDVEVAVTYGRDFLGRKARAVQRLTVQQPLRIDYAKKAPVNCADFFVKIEDKFLPLPGTLKKDSQGPNGRLIPFQATVFDQFGAAFKVPENKRLLVRELGRWIRIDEDAPGLDAKVGQPIEKSIPIGQQGTFTDQVGFCEDVPYPAGYLQTVDRCALTGASDLRIQRESVTYSGQDATIGISGQLGCPP